MLEIRLFCALGFSTGMLVRKMKEAAAKRNLEVNIEACGQGEMAACAAVADVALLSPQLGYTREKTGNFFRGYGIPVGVIPMQDYGSLNGEKVLDFALQLAEERKKEEK